VRQLIFLVAIVGSLAMPTPRAAAVVGEAIWTQVAKLPVGSGPGQVTYESHPTGGVGRGPQAFTVAPDGSIYVLDSMQRRFHVIRAGQREVATVLVPMTEYPLEIQVAPDGTIWLLDTDRVLHVTDDGTLLEANPLPTGMVATDVFRFGGFGAAPTLWIHGYRQLLVNALPLHANVRADLADKTGASVGGLESSTGKRWVARTDGPTIVFRAVGRPERVVVTPNTFFATAQPIAFDAAGKIHVSVQDAFSRGGVVTVEETIRRYGPSGELEGVARVPTERFVVSPHRIAEVSGTGTTFVMVPEATALVIYRVELGTTYRTSVARTTASRPSAKMLAKPALYGFPLRARDVALQRAQAMNNTNWNWHDTYNKFSDGTSRPADVTGTPPSQIASATEGTPLMGIPYTWGGADTVQFADGAYSHSDGQPWTSWDGADGALNKYYPGDGPLVGKITTDCLPGQYYSWRCYPTGAMSGTAGIDCSGYVYAAAGYSSADGLKLPTYSLNGTPGSQYAGLEAGLVDNLQPMNYFVRLDGNHVFYYEYRYADGNGISTLEATTDFPSWPGQGARQSSRNLRDLQGQWSHRSWWSYGQGDSYLTAITTQGTTPACMGIRGQMVWYKFSTDGTRPVTLTGISGGDPDLYVVEDHGSAGPSTILVGSSTHLGTQNESVTIGRSGNFYAYVHVYSTQGGCVWWTINW